MLSEDILIEIFDFYRQDAMMQSEGMPWKWHHLAHVCRKWRHVISMSPRRLDLRVLFHNRTPIEILHVWPTLPLVLSFKATRESYLMPRNITAALRHPNRLWKVELNVTSSMTESVAEMIQKPCQALESISITVGDATGASIPVRSIFEFLGGSAPHLEEIKLDGIFYPFPKIRQVLLSANNLVELSLFKIPNAAYFSPDDLVTGLSTLVRLKSLSVGFYSPASCPSPNSTHLSPQRTILPSLTSLDFRGTSEYLEEFVARINTPALCKITIRIFKQIFFEIPQLCQFIFHPNSLGSPTWVIVTLSAESVGVLFTLNGDNHCDIRTSHRQLDWQLSFVADISSQLALLLFGVRSLIIQKGDELPSRENVDSTEWLEFFRPFTHVTLVRVSEELLVPSIVQALVTEDMATVLPELFSLHLEGYSGIPPVVEAVEQFVAMRRSSGHTVFLSG